MLWSMKSRTASTASATATFSTDCADSAMVGSQQRVEQVLDEGLPAEVGLVQRGLDPPADLLAVDLGAQERRRGLRVHLLHDVAGGLAPGHLGVDGSVDA